MAPEQVAWGPGARAPQSQWRGGRRGTVNFRCHGGTAVLAADQPVIGGRPAPVVVAMKLKVGLAVAVVVALLRWLWVIGPP